MKIKKRYVLGILVVVIAVCIGLFRMLRKPGTIGPSPDEIVKEMLAFDQNGDGQLSKDELSERMQGLITRGDANQDGVLSQEELRKLAQAQFDATQRAAQLREGERRKEEAEK